MQAHDLAMLTGDELSARLGDSRRELFNLRFQLATGQLDNSSRIGHVRRDVARMLTVLRTREILEAEGAYIAPTAAQHEAAQAKLAAEDAAVAERAEAAPCRRRGRVGHRRRRPARTSRTTSTSTTTRTTTSTIRREDEEEEEA